MDAGFENHTTCVKRLPYSLSLCPAPHAITTSRVAGRTDIAGVGSPATFERLDLRQAAGARTALWQRASGSTGVGIFWFLNSAQAM